MWPENCELACFRIFYVEICFLNKFQLFFEVEMLIQIFLIKLFCIMKGFQENLLNGLV